MEWNWYKSQDLITDPERKLWRETLTNPNPLEFEVLTKSDNFLHLFAMNLFQVWTEELLPFSYEYIILIKKSERL